jgi:hypothetical protein
VTWPQFAGLLRDFSQEVYEDKGKAPLFVATCYEDARIRNKDYASASSMLLLDIDDKGGGWRLNATKKVLEDDGFESICYTSGRNENGNRFRVVVPLAEPIDLDTQRRAVRSLVAHLFTTLGGPVISEFDLPVDVDKGKLSPVVMFYVPGNY